MSCNVCIGGGDFYGPRIIDVELFANHGGCRCYECGKKIEDGTIAVFPVFEEYDCSGYDCDYDNDECSCPGHQSKGFETCTVCAEIRKVYSCGEGEIWGGLWDDFLNVWDEFSMSGECWSQLSAAAKAELVKRWQEWKGLA